MIFFPPSRVITAGGESGHTNWHSTNAKSSTLSWSIIELNNPSFPCYGLGLSLSLSYSCGNCYKLTYSSLGSLSHISLIHCRHSKITDDMSSTHHFSCSCQLQNYEHWLEFYLFLCSLGNNYFLPEANLSMPWIPYPFQILYSISLPHPHSQLLHSNGSFQSHISLSNNLKLNGGGGEGVKHLSAESASTYAVFFNQLLKRCIHLN